MFAEEHKEVKILFFSEARRNNKGRQYLIKYWVKYLIIAKHIVDERGI